MLQVDRRLHKNKRAESSDAIIRDVSYQLERAGQPRAECSVRHRDERVHPMRVTRDAEYSTRDETPTTATTHGDSV